MSTGPNYAPKGINVKINKKTYPSRCYQANILEIANNPQLDISDNVLYLTVNFIYLDPEADPCNPLNYLIIEKRKLAIDASGIFSIGNLQRAIENMYNLTPLETEWNNKDEYYMYNLTSYNNVNYESIIDTNINNQPDLSSFYSNAWAPYYNSNISYLAGDCVYYPYTYTVIGPTGCTGYSGVTGCTGATGFINPTGYTGPTGSYSFTTNYLYICTTGSAGGNTPPPPGSSSLYWQFYTWNYGLEYNLNAQTTYYSRNYLSIQSANINNEPNNSPTYWTEIWSSLVTYNIYDIVLYNTNYSSINNLTLTYMAITSSNINQEPLYKNSSYWAPKWIYSSIYSPGDIVYYTDTVSNITSAYVYLSSADQVDPPVTSTNISGTIVNTYNPSWQPYIWVSDYTYTTNSVVSYYGILYVSIKNSLNIQPDISPYYWARQYSMYKVYNITDLVYYIDENNIPTVYMSLININQNKNPSKSTTSWTKSFVSETEYFIGDFVYYTDLLIYLCTKNISGQDPTNSEYWQPYIWNTFSTNPCPSYSYSAENIIYYTSESQNYTQTNQNCTVTNTNTVYYRYKPFLSITNNNLNNIPGSLTSVYWANKWQETMLYSVGDIVYYNDDVNNKIYRSLQNNNIGNNPEDENTYWELYTTLVINIDL